MCMCVRGGGRWGHLVAEYSDGLYSAVLIDVKFEVAILSVCHQLLTLWTT